MKNITFCILMFYGLATNAQLIVSNTAETPAQLVQNVLVDPSVVPTNIMFNGSAANANQIRLNAGHFTTNFNQTNLGLVAGVILSTGDAQLAKGPNNAGGLSDPVPNSQIYNGDGDLSALTTNNVVNSAVLEFDFVATGLILNFDFVFASEEYPEYANSGFNDVFGFFLSGPNPLDATNPYVAKNIALIPGTNPPLPITINNLNNGGSNNGPCEFCQYYVNNGQGNTPAANQWIQYDGFTTVLKAGAKLKCGETYHIKLAVGNVGDNSFDSAVFLKNFRIEPMVLQDNLNLVDNLNVCPGKTVTINSGHPVDPDDPNNVPGSPNDQPPFVFTWSVNISDPYDPTAFTVLTNEHGPSISVTTSGVYQLVVTTSDNCIVAQDSITIRYNDPFKDPTPIVVCTTLPSPYTFNIDQTNFVLNGANPDNYFIGYYTSLADAESYQGQIPDADLAAYDISGTTADIWMRLEALTGADCSIFKHFTLLAGPEPSGTFSYPNSPYCGQIITPQLPQNAALTPGGQFTATPAGLSIDATTGAVNPSLSTPGNYQVRYEIAASATCPQFIVPGIPVSITETPLAPTATTPVTYCQGETASALTATGSGLLWYTSGIGGIGSATPPTPITGSPGTTNYYVSQTIGCEGPRTQITVIVNATPPAPTFTAPADYCQNATATALTATGSNLLWYTAATGGIGSATAPIPSTATPGTANYYVTQTVNGCESLRANIPVTTIGLPLAPTVTTPIGYCQDVVAPALTATGTGLLWYTAATGGIGDTSAPYPSTAAPGSITYYVSQTVNGCEGPRAAIVVNTSIIPPTPTFTLTQPTCSVNTGTITINSPTGINLEYSINNGSSYQPGLIFATVPAGTTYDVLVRNTLSGCTSAVAQAVVSPALVIPTAPTASTTVQPNCIVTTGTIEVSAPIGTNLEYTINGGTTYQASTTFTGLAPNTVYNISVRDNVNGCTSGNTPVTVNSIPANPAAPALTFTQPTCATPTATIVVTAPTGANLEYSLNSDPYQGSTTFAGLLPNSNYSIVVRNTVTGCESTATTGTIDPIPANPAIPTFTIVQPTCAVNTGSFTITAPTGTNFQYSNDGGTTYQAGVTFTGLTAGTTFNPIVRNTLTGCVSAPATVVINPALNVPVAPTMSVTIQPTCTTPFGTIVITAPTGANLSYSINGGTTFQTGTTFAGLAPNTTYSVIVKDNTSTCTSTSTAVVNPLPANPAAPTASATVQPNCINPTGTIVVTAPTGANFEYSINGGTTYQTGTSFASLAPNTTYNITVRNIATGCISAPTPIVISPIPANPAAPTAVITQPTCTTPTGSIAVSAPVGTDFEYSINGGTNYQAGTTFTPLAPNATYNIMVRNTVTGCISAPASFVINAAPTFPATPVVNGDNVCVGESINLTTAAVAGATYNWTGPNGFTSTAQNPVIVDADVAMSGQYSLIIFTTLDCPSLAGTVDIVVYPLPEPVLAQDGYICYNANTNAGDAYTLNAGLDDAAYDFKWFTVNGGNSTLIPTATQNAYTTTTPGTYAVQATNVTTGCVSEMVTATVAMSSPPLDVTAVSSNYFDDIQAITINVSPAGNYEYQLDNGAFQSSNVFTNLLPGHHDIMVRNACGQLPGVAYLLDFPRFFTPNGDGYNDTWNIFALSGQANAKIYIFDRYGKLLKEISPAGKGWDGTLNQQQLPGSDYWFKVYYEENNISKVFKSHFALKR